MGTPITNALLFITALTECPVALCQANFLGFFWLACMTPTYFYAHYSYLGLEELTFPQINHEANPLLLAPLKLHTCQSSFFATWYLVPVHRRKMILQVLQAPDLVLCP